MKYPKVSVIIPVYNAEKYLKQCLDSVTNQTLKEIEIICVDDGSTDKSLEILKEYNLKDNRIKIIKQTNSGAGIARNNAMKHSSGEFISFLDADDYYPYEYVLQHLFYEAEKNKVLICGGNLLYLKGNNIVSEIGKDEKYIFQESGLINYNYHQQAYFYQRYIYNRKMLIDNNIFFPNYRRFQDPPFFVKAMLTAKKFYAINENVYLYRINANKVKWDSKKIEDMLDGIKETLILSNNASLAKLHFFIAKELLNNEYIHKIIKDIILTEKSDFSKKFSEIKAALNYDLLDSINAKVNLQYVFLMSSAEYYNNLLGKKEIKLSIIIPIYNVEKYLPTCLESVINQTYKNLEIICVDDGSTDNSYHILKKYKSKDDRIKIIKKDNNEGLLLARKTGVKYAAGEYIMFVDADDYLELEACNLVLKEIEKEAVDILQFTIGVENYTKDKKSEIWLKKALTPIEKHLNGENILKDFYITRNITTSLLGKVYNASICKTAYKFIPDIYCYVGEDIFQQFFFGFFADSYNGIRTKPLYWYRYGLGISNKNILDLSKYEEFAKMGNLANYIEEFLKKYQIFDNYKELFFSISNRMFVDGFRKFYYFLDESNKLMAGKLLLKYWQNNPVVNEALVLLIGKTLNDFSKSYYEILEFKSLPKKFNNSIKPSVSVIIPIYNGEKYLEECLESVINQTFYNIEIICVNDGSNDDSLEIINHYAKKDDRIGVISQKNCGQSIARNVGINCSQGEYIIFLDCDDLLKLNAISKLYSFVKKNDLDILFYCADSFFENTEMKEKFKTYIEYYHAKEEFTERIKGSELMMKLVKCNEYRVSPCLQMIKREHLIKNKIEFFNGILHEDNLFTFKNILKADKTAKIKDVLYLRRVRSNSIMTKQRSFKNFYGFLKCYEEMIIELSRMKISDEAIMDSIIKIVYDIREAVYKNFKILNQEEKEKIKKMTFIERLWLENILNNYDITKNQFTNTEVIPLNKYNNIEKEINNLKKSNSYKIGRVITFIPRKIRGGIKCYKQHGVKYTLKRICQKLKIIK